MRGESEGETPPASVALRHPPQNQLILGRDGEGLINFMSRPRRSNPKTKNKAGELRREPTPAERKLWSVLRGNKLNGVSFRRQHAIGNYIVDFVSIKHKLIIELDGSQHLEQAEYDEERTSYLESQGYKVVRFWNHQIEKELDGVIKMLEEIINSKQ